jgi:hypothetical protein
MFANVLFGTCLISATVFIHTAGLIGLSSRMPRIVWRLRLNRHNLGRAVALVATVLGIFAIHTVEIWLWAAAYYLAGAIDRFDTALYLSTEMFSTAGSDIHPTAHWRQLSALESVNGFILIGWSIAYLVAASTRDGPFHAGEHF